MDEKKLMALAEALDSDNPKLKKEAEKAYNEIKTIAGGSDRKASEAAKKAVQSIEQYRNTNRSKKAKKVAHGAKLDYVKSLKHICPEGLEPYYYKEGGNLQCGCKGKKMEEGAKVEKASTGAVARFKNGPGKLKIQLPQLQKIHPSDTVHVKGVAYTLTNMDGSPVISGLPTYSGSVEKEDRKKAKAGDKDAQRRLRKAEEVTAPKNGAKLKTVDKFKKAKCGSKMKKK